MAITDKFDRVSNSETGRPIISSLAAPGFSIGGTTITLTDSTNWDNTTGKHFIIYETITIGNAQVKDSTTQTDWKGDLTGTTITGMVITGGIERSYPAGAVVELAPTAGYGKDLYDGISKEHKQDGTHSDITADSVTTDSLTITGSGDAEGWSALGSALNFESNDGAKQATYSITGVDKTDTLWNGMKVKTPRVTTVGTQCADLEYSSSQYASLASGSVSGCTFTDDFTCGTWVKSESLTGGVQYIFSRGNPVQWYFRIGADGTLRIGATGIDNAKSYQSIPLGEWVHIAATLDMSGNAGKIYVNGVEVTSEYSDSGSSLTNTGDLALGGDISPNNYVDGKLKHAFVANKVLSEAEVKEAMVSDALETSSFSANLVAYYKLEGDFTDDSGNSNDLTAQNGAVATDTDSPFSSNEYGIITSATFSTDTTAVIDFGSKVPVNENVTAPSYSTHNVPYGFPINVEHQQSEQVNDGVWIDYDAGWTGWSSFTSKRASYVRYGDTITVSLYVDGTSNSTSASCLLPVPPKRSLQMCHIRVKDNGATQAGPGLLVVSNVTYELSLFKTISAGNWTASGSKQIYEFTFTYQAG